ncbi:MAG: hypothetical protein R3B84_08065 [Zavarzinella sp.]
MKSSVLWGWVFLAVGIVAVLMLLEVIFRTVTNRYGTPQDRYPHRIANKTPNTPEI